MCRHISANALGEACDRAVLIVIVCLLCGLLLYLAKLVHIQPPHALRQEIIDQFYTLPLINLRRTRRRFAASCHPGPHTKGGTNFRQHLRYSTEVLGVGHTRQRHATFVPYPPLHNYPGFIVYDNMAHDTRSRGDSHPREVDTTVSIHLPYHAEGMDSSIMVKMGMRSDSQLVHAILAAESGEKIRARSVGSRCEVTV